ncbi:MAG TPA: hypothetical protein VNJ02_00050 [Vicinamibacterales bacterium]|nr:hypothetical protein [Vicinamibacterales bacterium]
MLMAVADTASADWFITPFAGLKFAGSTQLVDLEIGGARNKKFTFGAAATRLGDGLFGVEAEVAYVPRFFERSSGSLIARSHVLTVMGNLVISAPRELTGDSLRPFISGGGGVMHTGIDDVVNVFGVDNKQFAINIGGGATGRLSDVSAVRFDLRYFNSISNGDESNIGFGSTSLRFWRAAVGITLRY